MSSVTFDVAVGGDGSTVTDDNNATTGLRDGGWKTRFVPCFTQQVAVANYIVTKAGEASTSASAASSSATAAAASYDSFDDRYLGAKTSDPSVDNDGTALITGAIYWNSSSNVMKVWSGSAWVSYNPAISYLPLSGGTMTGEITFAAGQTISGYLPTTGGTMTGVIEHATGSVIASAATVNLNTATGNRVHITGTTTITAVTLTRGPRTVIFDGVLTLTHNATTNNLPGAVNITTAAGDRAIYESDGTIVYCISYIKANGTAVVSNSGVGNHAVVVHSGNGHGSINNKIRRFTTTLTNVGTAITYADSASNGASFTINESGIYSIYTQDIGVNNSVIELGASVNSTQLTTSIQSINVANRIMVCATFGVSPTWTGAISATVYLYAGDIVRPHTAGNCTNTTNYTFFSIIKVGV